MQIRILPAILVILWTLSVRADEPVKVIFDTDMGSDVDDVGAVAVLHALADSGEAEILAMGLSVKHSWSAPCLDALNTWYHRPDIPIGVLRRKGVDNGCKYAETIAKEYPHTLKSTDDAPDVIEVYRQILADQPDQSVVLVTVGFLTNVANLLDSPADAISDLAGVELVQQKVKLWVCMGGAYPDGKEYNFDRDPRSTQRALERWPVPVVFSGFEIGKPIQTGAGLKDLPKDNPIRRAYELYNGISNRSSWDQTAVLYGVRVGRGDQISEIWDVRRNGSNTVNGQGQNHWSAKPHRGHSYLEKKMPSEQVAKLIEKLMLPPSPH